MLELAPLEVLSGHRVFGSEPASLFVFPGRFVGFGDRRSSCPLTYYIPSRVCNAKFELFLRKELPVGFPGRGNEPSIFCDLNPRCFLWPPAPPAASERYLFDISEGKYYFL